MRRPAGTGTGPAPGGSLRPAPRVTSRGGGGVGAVTVARLVVLARSAHAGAGARALAAVRRQLHHDLVPRHVVPGDHAWSLRGGDLLADLGRVPVKVLVG